MRVAETPEEALGRRRERGALSVRRIAVLILALVAAGVLSAWMVPRLILGAYDGRIYPNVYVLDVELGGLTREQAMDRLAEAMGDYNAGTLTLTDGQHAWAVPWSEAGLRLDVDATIQAAFAVGRADGGLATLLSMREERRAVTPLFTLDPEPARGVLERLAPEVAVPPSNATLDLEGDQPVAVPGRPGRVLDVDATLEKIVATVTHLGPENQFALTFQTVPPKIPDTRAAQARAEEMLNREMEISTYDWITDESFTWTLGRRTIASWLYVDHSEDGRVRVRVDEEAVQITLENLAQEMGQGRGFPMEEAAEDVLHLFENGGGALELDLTHPVRTAIVQPGDDLTAIGARFGVPPGLIAELNPEVDLDHLQVGQELTVPSWDAVIPYPPVPGKKIVISIAEQRMRVYEGDQLLYDWPVSTGMAGSPTYTGQFQILSKEENAYASQWELWMPHFIAVYRAGGAVYNGIHALPILSDGQRLWEGALGSPASFGCIILGVEEAETLYNWAEIGLLVTIE